MKSILFKMQYVHGPTLMNIFQSMIETHYNYNVQYWQNFKVNSIIFNLGWAQTPRASENGVCLSCQLSGDFACFCDVREVTLPSKFNLVAVLPQFILQAVEALDDQGVRH